MSIICDRCKEPVVHGFSVGEVHREGYATWEGRQTKWDFCSATCAAAHFRKLSEERARVLQQRRG